MNIQDRLLSVMERGGDVPAIIFEGCEYSWSAVSGFSKKLRSAIASADPEGKTVALVLRNRPAAAAAVLAVLAAGRCAAPISGIQPPQRLCKSVLELRPSLLIAEERDWTTELESVMHEIGGAGLVISSDAGGFEVIPRTGLENATSGIPNCAPDDAGLLKSTSGTTGPAKRIPMTWDQMSMRYDYEDRPIVRQRGLITVIPLATSGGLKALMICATKPQPLVLMERLDVQKWADLVKEHRPKVAGLPPAGLRMLMDADIPADRFESLESWYTGSGPMDPDLAEALEDRYGKPIIITYGATEFGRVAAWTADLRRKYAKIKRGSSGKAVPGVDIQVVDPVTGDILPTGQSGILEVHVPDAHVPGTDYWTSTNDIGRIDEDGFLFVEGRADDVIIRGGLKVPLFALESEIMQHPLVEACVAVGLPDKRLGQVPAALVVPAPESGDALDEATLVAWLRERIPAYHVPVKIKFADALPVNPMMKVSRPSVRDLLLTD